MFKIILLFVLMLFLYGINAYAQIPALPTDIPNILPPSPTAADLGKFALAGDNLVTGSANTHIALYNYTTKNLSIPISLDYSSDGIKVDQVATRVGLGWTLNAGGCISRTVVGLPDEIGGYLAPPSDWPNTTGTTLDNYLYSVTLGGRDTQPDIYSFNFSGYSGRFILQNGVITKLEQNNLIISGSVENGFTIITPDGVKYTFNASESTQSINASHPGVITNAWFLTKIEHPEGDVITLSYNTCQYIYQASASQTDTYFDYSVNVSSSGYVSPSETPSSRKASIPISNRSVYLSEISSNSVKGGYLKFIYSPRQDISGEYSLSNVELYTKDNPAPSDLAIKNIEFGYYYATANRSYANEYSTANNQTNQRLFLTSVLNDDQNYQFSYNDIDNLPPRLSYSQDDFGFFNGKSNASLIPQPASIKYSSVFSQYGFGDRSSDWNYAQKGLLNKIIYPTGGYQAIDYEANTVNATASMDCSQIGKQVNFVLTGDSYLKNNNVFCSPPFHVSCAQQATINLAVSLPAWASQPDPMGEDLVSVGIFPAGTFFNSISPGAFNLTDVNHDPVEAIMGQNNGFSVLLAPGDYVLAFKVQGNSHAYCSFNYTTGVAITGGNQEVAGVRVKRITSYDAASNHTSIKRYYYGDLTTNLSSGHIFSANPTHESNLHTYVNLYATLPVGQAQFCDYSERFYTKFSSANTFGLSNLTGNHIYYDQVFESNGENFEDGGIEHDFANLSDSQSAEYMGLPINGAPLANSGINSHQEIQKSTFYKNGSTLTTTNKVITKYYDDPRLSTINTFYAFQAETGGRVICLTTPYNLGEYSYMDIAQYYLYSRWTYASTIKTIQYDNNGLNPVTKVDSFIYNNPAHQLLSAETEVNSKGETYATNNLYPQDNTSGLSTTALAAQANLVSKNIISPVLVQQVSKNGTLLHTTKVNYLIWPSTLTLPQTVETQYGNAASETRVNFNNYDNNGNILQQQKANGPVSSFLWDYTHSFVIAEATNANFNDIAYTSFEADGSGNWTIPTATMDLTGLTGTSSYNLTNGAITKTGLTSATTYIVSYWLKSSTPLSIAGTVTGYPITGRSYNGWTYFEHQVTGQTAITISGGSIDIDELRLYPANAQMTSYTYLPLTGITTVNDTKNNINYYEYDSNNHLKNIKDQNGNIVKSYDYNYAGTQVNYGANLVYYNTLQSANFTRSNCSTGAYGTTVAYTIPAGAYSSIISQSDADNQAISTLNNNGPGYANSNGICVTCDLTNLANKIINGVCEAGTQIYTSSAKQNTGGYICTYYYIWSDGSFSPVYKTLLSSQPCVNLN